MLPEDVTDLAPDVFRHRLVLTYEALADGITPDELIQRVMQHVPAPEKPLETHVRVAAAADPAPRRPAATPPPAAPILSSSCSGSSGR